MKFSIVIPVYNRPQELRRALRSCVTQTYGNFEVIVVDDCSTEDVKSVCEQICDNRIHYVRNEYNMGSSESRNQGMKFATGDYICFLDSDDLFLPEKLSRVRDRLVLSPADIVLHSQFRVFSLEHDAVNFEIMPKASFEKKVNIAEFIFKDGNFIQTNTFTLRRDFISGRRFDGKYKLWDDTHFIVDCCQDAQNVEFIEIPLSVFFDFSDAKRISQKRELEQHTEMLAYLDASGFEKAARYFRAMAVADAIFYNRPLTSIRLVIEGLRAGVSFKRSVFYLARCVFGFGRMKAVATYLKSIRPSGGTASEPPPELVTALNRA